MMKSTSIAWLLLLAWYCPGAPEPVAQSGRQHGGADWRQVETAGSVRTESVSDELVWHFDGAPYAAALPVDAPELDITGEVTVSLWFNCRRLPVAGDKADAGTLLGRGWNWEHRITPEGRIRVEYQTPTFTPHLTGSTAVSEGSWNMLTTVYSGTRQSLQIYLNGVLTDEFERPDWHPEWGALKSMAGHPLRLGGDPDGYNPFTGSITGVTVFDRALTPAEVAELFAAAPPVIAGRQRGEVAELAAELDRRRSPAAELLNTMAVEALPPASLERLAMYGRLRLNGVPALDGMLCWIVKASGATAIRPDTALPERQLGTRIRLVATPGEYESASFVLASVAPSAPLEFTVGDLVARSGATIPASRLDLKLVQCWYQAGTAWRDINQVKNIRLLVPELLLNDPGLVKVDDAAQRNYLRLDGEYVDISEVADDRRSRWDMRIANAEFPVRDAAELQPVAVAPFRNQQFFLTLHAPADVPPGVYSGVIAVSAGAEPRGELVLQVRILPFTLAEPEVAYAPGVAMDSSIYYCTMGNDGDGGITPHERSWIQVEAELRDLLAHGVTNPLNYQLEKNSFAWGPEAAAEFRRMLQLRRDVGLKIRPVYLSGPEANLRCDFDDSPESLARIATVVPEIIDIVEELYGHRDVYFYGRDEAAGEELIRQLEIWRSIHAAGGKVFVAGFKPGMFEATGATLDLFNACGSLDAAEAARWHGDGKRIWSYSNPQGGVENPDVYRRNYGLRLYMAGYDGGCTYLYYEAMGNPWNDFDGDIRDINMVYPAVDGVIGTIAWEGYREGVDDIRYMTTLVHTITAARNSGDAAKLETAQRACDWIAELNGNAYDPDTTRLEIIRWILTLL